MSNKNLEENQEEIILIAKMYTGEYIQKNIGHEIINFFKPDNKDYYYGYIPYNGKVKNTNKIHTILLVSEIKGRRVKVLAKISNPEFISAQNPTRKMQEEYIINNDIKYGNVYLHNVMNKYNLNNYDVYITYKADKIQELKEDYYLLLKECNKKFRI